MRSAIGCWLLTVACGAEPPRSAVTPSPTPAVEVPEIGDAGTTAAPGSDAAPEPPPLPAVPRGPASFNVHIPPGGRQPVTMAGRIGQIQPPRGDSGLDAWFEITLEGQSASPQKLYFLNTPDSLKLPFSAGDRISAEVDCRKGGWHRVCDALIRDAKRRVVVIVSGSGDDRIASGWKIERGPVATSEIRPGGQKSVLHTFSLQIGREGRSIPVAPHEWHRFQIRGESWLVHGYEVEWEGVRPADAVNHRTFVLLRER